MKGLYSESQHFPVRTLSEKTMFNVNSTTSQIVFSEDQSTIKPEL
jgi:hypothetical protein